MSTEQQSNRLEQILSALRWANLDAGTDDRRCQSPEPQVRCDIAIMRNDGHGVETVIVCAEGNTLEDLAAGLGRVQICRHLLDAEHAIICLPPGEFPPEVFLETCAHKGVRVASDTRILHALAWLGVVDGDLPARYEFMKWMSNPAPVTGSSMFALVTQLSPVLRPVFGAN